MCHKTVSTTKRLDLCDRTALVECHDFELVVVADSNQQVVDHVEVDRKEFVQFDACRFERVVWHVAPFAVCVECRHSLVCLWRDAEHVEQRNYNVARIVEHHLSNSVDVLEIEHITPSTIVEMRKIIEARVQTT